MFLQNFVLLFLFCLLSAKYGECDVFGSFDLDKSKTFGIDEVRCYCNMAECITTGYMCKSQKLGCFSDLAAVTSPSSIEMVTHGCLDLLDKSLQTTCRNLPGKSDSSSSPLDTGAPKSLLLCCSEDMCNDVDIPSNRMDSSNQVFNISDPLFTDKSSAGRLRRPNLTFTTELFFRLATFAVPVLGGMILFMLVTLAIKLLRSDANEDRMVAMKLRQNDAACLLLNKTHFPNSSGSVNDFEASSKKIPLLYQYDRTHLPPGSYLGNRVNLLYPVLPGGQQQHVEKNKTNAKLNNVSATYNTPGSNLDQPLLKINSGTHSQQVNCNTFGAMPWGGGVFNNLGQTFCPEAANMSAALNQFVSNVSGCQLSAPQNVSDNLSSSSVHLGKSVPCCSAGANVGNVDGAIPTTSDHPMENPSATLESDGATCSANLQNVSAVDGATTIDSSPTNHANFLNVPATNHGIVSADDAASDTTSGNIVATSGNVSATSRIGAETCCDHLETSKLNLQCAAPCNISSPQGSHTTLDPRMSTNSAVSSQKHNAFPCSASSLLGVNATNTPIPVFGPFACITTQATSDEHPIFSLQKSSEHPICNKLQLSCDCCSGCSNKCFEKTFSSSHGCNLCQDVDGNERLTASNSSVAACNNFDSEDDTKLNYKKNLMPSFCTN